MRERGQHRLLGAVFLDVPWQGCLSDVQELLWGGCRLGFLSSHSECGSNSLLPDGIHTMSCPPSALTAGLRSLLLKMRLPPVSVAACCAPDLHPTASRLGMQTFDTQAISDVSWIIAGSHRSVEIPIVGVAMSARRWRDFLQRGFFPCVPCCGASFLKIQLPLTTAQSSSFDVVLHKVSDFLENIDERGRPSISEDMAALLRHADGTLGRPICLDGPFSLSKVVNRACMYATLDACLNLAEGFVRACTPPYFKVSAGEQMAAAWEKAQTLGMSLPLLIKPLPACSLPGAHDFQLVGSLAGIDRVTQDSIVQQFIPHNGTVYKIGVIGDQVQVSERDSSNSMLKSGLSEEVVRMRDASSKEQAIAACVKEAFGMSVFGFDVILDSITGQHNIVDVNHLPSLKDFPGAKEALWSLCNRIHTARSEAICRSASHVESRV